MGTKMTNGPITIEVFFGADIDFYKRAGYSVVVSESAAPPAVESAAPAPPEEKNAEAVATVNKSKAKK